MHKRMIGWRRYMAFGMMGSCLLGMNCLGGLQREIEVLLRPEANLLLIGQSGLVRDFGVGILRISRWLR